MATNFSPCQGSYVLNQFPSIVMSGMKGFNVSASEAIQGHHGQLLIHRTPVVERHPIRREIRDFQVDTTGKHGLFLHEQVVHLHTENTQMKLQT